MKNLRKWLLLSFFVIGTSSTHAQTVAGDQILGAWLNEDKSGTIEIYKQGQKYFGRIISGKDMLDANGQPKLDVRNPNAALRTQMTILKRTYHPINLSLK